MYEGVSTNLRINGGKTYDFPITICWYQGSTLSFYPFILLLDILTKHIQELASRFVIFVDDISLFIELNNDLNERLRTWR